MTQYRMRRALAVLGLLVLSVFTLAMSGSAAMSPLGLVIAGPVADALGVQIWFLIGGLATVIMGVGSFFVPAIMRIEDKAAEVEAMP